MRITILCSFCCILLLSAIHILSVPADGDQLVWSTFLGGSDSEQGASIAVDVDDNVYVIGWTVSADFPTTSGAFWETYHPGHYDAFVAKFDPEGSTLCYATFLGGDDYEEGTDIVVDREGCAFAFGHTGSVNFPTTPGAYDSSLGGTYDLFIVKLNPDGSGLSFSTLLGGSLVELSGGLAVDSLGCSFLSGATESTDFPTTSGAFQDSLVVGNDALVVKLRPDGSGLIYSTLLGGSSHDDATDIVVDSDGNAYISGSTVSADFPVTAGAYDTHYNNRDAFVAKLNPQGTSLVFSSFLGGTDRDRGRGITIDEKNNIYAAGMTNSVDFPTTAGSYDRNHNGSYDLFVVKFNPQGSDLLYSTLLGGNDWEDCLGIAADVSGCAYVSGYTYSVNFPTTAGAFLTAYGGEQDVFLSKLSPNGDALAYSTFLGMSGDDYCDGIALSNSGEVYLTGYTFSADFPTTPAVYERSHHGSSDVFVAKMRIASGTRVDEPVVEPSPKSFVLLKNHPNPFNTSTDIHYQISEYSDVVLRIFDVLGQGVATLVDKHQLAGEYVVTWDGTNDSGRDLASGVYFCRLQAGRGAGMVKMVLLK